MNFSQLEYIVSVNKHKHFGHAAKENFVTQPTLSMMIKKLEEELGVQLFDRSRNPIKTTTAGKLVIQQAQVILYEKEILLDKIQDSKETLEGTFSIGIIPTLAPYLLPAFIPAFHCNYPEVKLEILELTTEIILQKLRDNTLDVAILATPLDQSDMIEHTLFQEKFYLYSDKKKDAHAILPSDIDINRLMLLEEGHCFRAQVLNLCEMREKLQGSLQYKIGSIETLINLVDKGQGSTIIPQLAYNQLSAKRKTFVTPFLDPKPARTISLIHHFSFFKNKFVEILQKEIVSSLPKSFHKNETVKIVPI